MLDYTPFCYGKLATSYRASRLDRFDNDSRFNANERSVDKANNGLLEIVQYAGTYLKKRLSCKETCGKSFAVTRTLYLLSGKPESIKQQKTMLSNLEIILKIIFCFCARSCCFTHIIQYR